MANYYAHQDDCLFQMKQHKTGFVEMPTGTGKGEIICSHAYDMYNKKSKKIKISVTVSHRILLSQQLLQRHVSFFLDKKEQPSFRRICVHSGDKIEYGRDDIDEQIWLAAYPDDKCGSIASLEQTIVQSIELGQDIAISTTYHSLSKTYSVLKSLNLKADVVYLDELHRGVERDEWFTVLKNFIKLSKNTYGFSATPGKQKTRIESLLGDTIYYMDSHTAINKGLICKPMWMIVDVDGNKMQHLAKGVVTAFNEHQSRMSIDAKMLLHCFDSQEIATVGDSHEIKSLMKQNPDLLVAEVSSARGARINGKELDRLEWLKTLNQHKGKMLVLHIDICNSGLDVPGFTFGLWTYMSASETYATQGNGRSGRIVKEDRTRLERGEISTSNYSQWVKPYNVCGLLFFNDTVSEDEHAFVDFILRSRDQGFNPEDIVYTDNKHGVLKSDPFAVDGNLKSPYIQSRIAIAISIRFENEALKELLHSTKKLDPMNIFEELIMYKLRKPDEKLKALQEYYRLYGNSKASGLSSTLESHSGFIGTKQWVFTNPNLFDISRISIENNQTWGVIINVELVEHLIKLGIDRSRIKFYSDNIWRATWAEQVSGINKNNIFVLPADKTELRSYIKMQEKSVDYVLNNVPFGMFKEFKELAQKLSREKALIISGSRDYKNSKAFENVEYYKYLGGKAFPTAQIIASLAIIDPKGSSTTQIIDNTGKLHPVATATMQPPGEDIDGWLLATQVAALNLAGYKANMGSLYYEKVIEDLNGTNCIFTVGDADKPSVFGRTKKISANDLPMTKGLGDHKLVISKTGTAGKLGAMKYADPSWAVGFGTYFITFSSKQDVLDAIAYCQSPAVEKLVKGVKPNTVVNGQAIWKQIPHHSLANQWTHLA